MRDIDREKERKKSKEKEKRGKRGCCGYAINPKEAKGLMTVRCRFRLWIFLWKVLVSRKGPWNEDIDFKCFIPLVLLVSLLFLKILRFLESADLLLFWFRNLSATFSRASFQLHISSFQQTWLKWMPYLYTGMSNIRLYFMNFYFI